MLSFGGTMLSNISDKDLRSVLTQARDAVDGLLADDEQSAYQGDDTETDGEDVRRGSIGLRQNLLYEGGAATSGASSRPRS